MKCYINAIQNTIQNTIQYKSKYKTQFHKIYNTESTKYNMKYKMKLAVRLIYIPFFIWEVIILQQNVPYRRQFKCIHCYFIRCMILLLG